jgi:hypothetical protein
LLVRGERGAAAQLRRRPWRGGGRCCRAAMVLRSARGGEVAHALNRCSSPTWSEEGRRGDTRGQELVRQRAARARATRPRVCLPRDAARTARIPAVSRRTCPPREVRGLGRRGLRRRIAPGRMSWRYSATRRARRGRCRGVAQRAVGWTKLCYCVHV